MITRVVAGLCVIALSLVAPVAGFAAEEDAGTAAIAAEEGVVERTRHPILMYIPNRIFDVFDIVRVRARIGPGIQAGVRATDPIDFSLGAYQTFWVGVPGPRTRPRIPWIMGLEARQGMEVGIFEGLTEEDYGPGYQWDEIGLDLQALVAGASVGVSFAEVFDLVLGVLFIDISGDDY